MPLQISPTKEFCRGVVTVSPPFTDRTLNHPPARARVAQVPFGIMPFGLHARPSRVSQTTLLSTRRASACETGFSETEKPWPNPAMAPGRGRACERGMAAPCRYCAQDRTAVRRIRRRAISNATTLFKSEQTLNSDGSSIRTIFLVATGSKHAQGTRLVGRVGRH